MADNGEWRLKDDEEDEEEELDETVYKSQKDAVLFVIEVSESMLSPPPPTDSKKLDRDTSTTAALKCAYSLMQQRIISHPNDMMGVLLYGTQATKFQDEEQARGSLSYPHCYLLSDLNVPSADDVKALRDLVNEGQDWKTILAPSSEPVSMSNVLFCANQIFTTKAPNFTSRRLFIVTDNDDPHKNDPTLRSSAAVRAKDLYDLGVVIELFPISNPGHDFDRKTFYDDIIYNVSPTDPEAPAQIIGTSAPTANRDGVSLLQSLLSSINSKAVAKRALFSTTLEIGPEFKISVKGYIIFKKQSPKRSCYVWLEGEKPQIAVGTTTQITDDSARAVGKVEIKKAFKFGGEQIVFSTDEVAKLRHFGDPGIRIIGFKPISMLPVWANTKPSTFIYPSEEDYVGSTRVFSALQQKLLKDKKIALTWFIPRKNALPVIAALFSGEERVDERGGQVMPPGMWLSPIPFADDIRQNPETTLIRSSDALTDRMRTIMVQMQLPKAQYDPSKYPNPSLQWFYRVLQALAMEEDLPEIPEDKTVPKYRQIQKRVGDQAIDWGEELENLHRTYMDQRGSSAVPAKRSAPTSQHEVSIRAGKRVRASEQNVGKGPTDDRMSEAFENKTLYDLSVAEMNLWLKAKKIRCGGNKHMLVARIEEYFDKQKGPKIRR